MDDVAEAVLSGASLRSIVEDHATTFIKYHRGIERMKEVLDEDREEAPHVVWLWGKAGVGKTRRAIESHASCYIKDGTQWWNGYNQEEAIVIDDFDFRWPYRDLLRLLDRYKYQGQTKGGYVKINSPYIYITCEHPPSYHWAGNELKQVLRRVAEVAEVAGNT